MATTTRTSQQSAADDEDLQHLYNEVWAGFLDEPSPAVTRTNTNSTAEELESLYGSYGGDDAPTKQGSRGAFVSPATASKTSRPPTRERPLPEPTAQSPIGRKGLRPLPPTPGAYLSSSIMPESQPYDPRRELPAAPSNGAHNVRSSPSASSGRPRTAGIPTDSRPQYTTRHTAQSASFDGSFSMPIPETNDYYSTHAGEDSIYAAANPAVTRQRSTRPPGAGAPYNGAFEDDVQNESPMGTGDLYQHQDRRPKPPEQYRVVDPPLRPYSPPHLPSSSIYAQRQPQHHTPSEPQFQAPPTVLTPPEGTYFDIQSPAQQPPALSTGSFTSSSNYPHTERHNSTTTNPTTATLSDAGRSSSFATSLNRGDSTGTNSYKSPVDTIGYLPDPYTSAYPEATSSGIPSTGGLSRRSELERMTAIKGPLELHHEEDDPDMDWADDESEGDDSRFVNFSLLSHIAVRLRDRVPRGTHVKGSIPYPKAFTGKDIVSTIQSQIQRELLINHGVSTNDRRAALLVARSLQSQLFFYEVEWGGRVLQDGVEDVYMFLDDQEGGSDARPEREELPTGLITGLTKCYSPSCGDGGPCYAYACPRKRLVEAPHVPVAEPVKEATGEWSEKVPNEVLNSLPESEIKRQTIIHKMVSKEEQYIGDLDTVESLFIRPLRNANPPVMPFCDLDEFIEDVFGNILDLRECNRRLLEAMYVRQREQAPVIQRIGDVFLEAATEFRLAYPIYIGHLPLAEKRLKDEIEINAEFRLFLEDCYRQSARLQDSRRLDLKHFLTRPSEHLQKYPVLLEAILSATAEGNPDTDYVSHAIQAIQNLQNVAQLRTFQSAMGKGAPGKWEWHDLVSVELRQGLSKEEGKRQSIIFELIKGEMAYVKDLENIEIMYVRPLRSMDPPIIPRERLESFIHDVYHNFGELHAHHRKLLDQLHEIQREEHPIIRTITAPLFDAALNFRDSYMEYVPNYPIAAYRIDDEMATNDKFKVFCEQVTRHADAHRLDMKNFINRPIPRLLRYELLLKGILEETPQGHEDREAIPQVLDVIKALGKETEPGVQSAKQKVQLWNYNANIVFKPGEAIDMDLLDENRSLIHTGKLLRQPDTGFEWNGWSELFVLLFDNYLVFTKPKDRDGVTKYHVNRKPIPLDLLTLANFTDPPTQRNMGLFKIRGGQQHTGDQTGVTPAGLTPDTPGDARAVYPCTIHHNGRLGGLNTFYAETAAARAEWKAKLEEATGLRKVVQESNKVFEIETLSTDTFLVPSMAAGAATPSWNHENSFTGKVTCSVPFSTADGRALVAIGCAEGVWIGFRHDSRSMRRVLHLKMVTQCAMLEDFGIFLVLADKSLFAYHIEALVPSSPQSAHTSQTPQKLNGTKDVHFFSVGNLNSRTLIIYMKKKGLDSVFRVLEPVVGKINEKTRAPVSLSSRLGIRSQRSEWFRVYRDFFLPSESFDLIFLKAKIAILCTKGFEIMDLTDFKSVTIPLRDEARLEKLVKRSESCKPKGMFRIGEEFLLCYDEFGLYVDKHGEPSRSLSTIEWEGTAEQVAIHPPYVLLFDSRFIEVRHISTGRLAQIIPGNDIHCLWDGRGLTTNIVNTSPENWQDGMSQDARVHGAMNAPEPVVTPGAGPRPMKAVAQHVFELVPTIPLYLPGSLASPSNSTAFPQPSSSQSTSFPQPSSPRLSPNLSSSGSWR